MGGHLGVIAIRKKSITTYCGLTPAADVEASQQKSRHSAWQPSNTDGRTPWVSFVGETANQEWDWPLRRTRIWTRAQQQQPDLAL